MFFAHPPSPRGNFVRGEMTRVSCRKLRKKGGGWKLRNGENASRFNSERIVDRELTFLVSGLTNGF